MYLSFIFLVFICLILFKFIMNFSHLIISLLCLELMSLLIFFIYFHTFNLFLSDVFFMLYFIIMLVSEGVIGLCVLITMNRVFGCDYLFSINNLMC